MEAQLYLYTGPEFGKRNDAVEAVKNSLTKKLGQIDNHLFYLSETPFSQVMTILQSGTLFSDGVCIVCKNAELLKKKEDIQMLTDWQSNPEPTAALILISDEISVDSKLEKLISKQNRQKFWEMYESDKLPWVINHFKKNGYLISQDAAQLILDLIENNTEALKQECSRFFIIFPKDHEITEKDVESVLTHTREENVFSLFNQMSQASLSAQKRLESALDILQKIRLSNDSSSVKIIMGLASCFRKLITWHKIHEEYQYIDSNQLKTMGFSSVPMQNQYKNAAKIWTSGQSAAILSLLASTDMEIRTGGTLMENVLLQKALYEIIIKKGGSMASVDADFI